MCLTTVKGERVPNLLCMHRNNHFEITNRVRGFYQQETVNILFSVKSILILAQRDIDCPTIYLQSLWNTTQLLDQSYRNVERPRYKDKLKSILSAVNVPHNP